MEKHPIESWYNWVSELHPAVLLRSAEDALNVYLAAAQELKETLKMQLLRDTLYNKSEKEIELLVEMYQIKVAHLMDQLFHFQQDESITYKLKEFYGVVAAQLETVIVLLQKNYSRYFNSDLNLPLSLRLREANEIKKHWKLLFKTMRNSETNACLVNILDQSIKEILHLSEGTAISYRQVAYFKNLLKEVFGYLSTIISGPIYASITELLISLKFNDFAFLREVCSNIRVELENKESNESKLEFLKYLGKQLGQLLEQNNLALHAAQPTAKAVILDWIDKELAYLQVITVIPEKKDEQEGSKMHTSLSVAVLAAIARLFKDSGMITNSNLTEIFKFFSSHFTTHKQSEFSQVHLRNRYYQIEESTKKKVYDYLMELGQLCKKL